MQDLRSSNYIPYFFGVPIAVLYGIFFTKLLNIMFNYEEVNNQCDGIQKYTDSKNNSNGFRYIGSQMTEEYKQCRDKRKEDIESIELKKFNIMMIIGFIGIIVGVILHKQNIFGGGMSIAGAGLGVGGVLTIIYYIILHWRKMNDKKRLFISGGILSSLIYASYALLK